MTSLHSCIRNAPDGFGGLGGRAHSLGTMPAAEGDGGKATKTNYTPWIIASVVILILAIAIGVSMRSCTLTCGGNQPLAGSGSFFFPGLTPPGPPPTEQPTFFQVMTQNAPVQIGVRMEQQVGDTIAEDTLDSTDATGTITGSPTSAGSGPF